MADFVFKIQPNIILGAYTTARLGQYVKEFGNKFMLIIDPILKQVGVAEKVTNSLSDRKIDFFTYDSIPAGADTKVASDALVLARQAHIDGIIAVGGGKTVSIARSICAVYNETKDLYDFVDGEVPKSAPLPLIALPTTLRDNFLFTNNAPIVDARSGKLKLVKTQTGLCKLALFDPNLPLSLSENQTAAMAIEILCIATEAYLSPRATFFSDMIAEKAVELLSYAQEGSPSLTITTPKEVLFSQAGCMASLASACSSSGAAELLALCLNARHTISRSLSTAILFPYIIEDAAQYRSDRLAKISRLMRSAESDSSDADAVKAFAEYVRQSIAKANLPSRLKDLSLNIEKLSLVAEDAGELDLMQSLQRSMTSDDLFEFIKKAF